MQNHQDQIIGVCLPKFLAAFAPFPLLAIPPIYFLPHPQIFPTLATC